MKIEIYSDVACPWCWIGERRFARALAAFPGGEEIRVEFRPFQLDPDAPDTPAPLRDHLRRKFGARVEQVTGQVAAVGRAEGIDFDFERAVAVNTLNAHRLMRLALREHGPSVQRALAEKLFEAHFSRGADVSDRELLVTLAAAVGMDPTRVTEYLRSGEGEEETRAEITTAVRVGVRAVPTFVFDGRLAVEGAQPTSTLLKVLEEVASEADRGGVGAPAVEDGDVACADGSCAAG